MKKFGKDQVMIWRRSYDTPPPKLTDLTSEHNPANDPRYSHVPPSSLPLSESLSCTHSRVLPAWTGPISSDVRSGDRVLVVAHGNTLRSLLMMLDGIEKEDITGLDIPTGVPLLYHLDEDLRPVKVVLDGVEAKEERLISGVYLGDGVAKRIEAVKNQTK